MKNIGLFIFVGLMMISCIQTSNQETSAQEEKSVSMDSPMEAVRDGVFIHITESYGDPHRLLMPLKMAKMMAADKDVIVYMDIHAVEILVKGSKDLKYADFESAHSYIQQLADLNIGVYACPSCLKVAGFEAKDLLEGVQTAQKDKLFDFTKGRIITLDY